MVKTLNFTLDAPSPLIYYSPGDWRPVTPQDPELPLYNRSTALTSLGAGAPTAQYSFVGTGIWVFGAKRDNHGLYRVTFDDDTTALNGYASPDLENQVLFSVNNLEQGPHAFQVVNAGNADGTRAFFDIDYVLWESQVPDGTTTYSIDNTDPSFTYLPRPTAWGDSEDGTTSFNATLTTTTDPNGQARLDFVGEIVALFGTLGPTHGNYSCSIDGGEAKTYPGTYPSVTTQQVLCFADSLGPGRHSLMVSNVQTGTSGDALSVDYAQVWSTQKNDPATSGAIPISPSRMTKTGVIIGGVVAACLIVAAGLVFFYLFWYRPRRRRRRKQNRSSILTQGPGRVQAEDGTHVMQSADLPREHLTPFVVNQRSSRQAPPGLLPTTTYRDASNSHSPRDSKGSTQSDSTSTEQTRSTLQPSELPPLPDSKVYIFPMPTDAETSRRPLRLREAPLSPSEVSIQGITNAGELGDSGRPVKLLPTPPVAPLQRSNTVGYANVIQEEDGGGMNEAPVYRVPPAYSQLPRQ